MESPTPEELAEFWKVWSEYDRPIEQAVTWADVKSNIVAEGLAAQATSSSWKIYEAALMLVECDSWRSVLSCGSKETWRPSRKKRTPGAIRMTVLTSARTCRCEKLKWW